MVKVGAVTALVAGLLLQVAAGCVAAPRASSADVPARWRPAAGVAWQWQLSGTDRGPDTTVAVPVYDLDGVETTAATVTALHRQGRRVLCYVDAGSWERWRPDAGRYPPAVLGRPLEGWPGERWVDVTRLDVLGPILRDRVKACRSKGFDGVEFDNVESFDTFEDSGLRITRADQLRFNRWLARTAHDEGLAAALKNDGSQAAELEPDFDLAVTEDCHADRWCAQLRPFLGKGKPVLAAEYTDRTSPTAFARYCAARDGTSLILKRRALGAWRVGC